MIRRSFYKCLQLHSYRKQFAEIAKFVAKDKVTLAKAILTSPSEEQQELLKRFYLNKDATLSLAFESPTEITATAGQISTRKQSSKSGGQYQASPLKIK